MAYPPAYTRTFSFTDYEVNFPGQPKPGDELDAEYDAVSNALTATQTNLALIQRADGQLANDSVGEDQLQDGLLDGITDGITADAEAAADAAAASASAAAASAASASADAALALTSRNESAGFATQAGVSQTLAQAAADNADAAANDAAIADDNATSAANEAEGFRNEALLHEETAFKWAEYLAAPVAPAPPGWPEAVDDGMFSAKWWALRARDYNATSEFDFGSAGTDIGNAFDIWDAIPGNELPIGAVYATWGSPPHTYVLTDPSDPSDPASWTDTTGGPGPAGPPNTLTVGTVVTGSPGTPVVVTITGTSPNQVLNMTIPQGNTGAAGPQGIQGVPGPANNLTAGTVTTGAPGSAASVTITGASPNQTINFTIPEGQQGIQGPIGPAGPQPPLADPTGTIGLTAVNGVSTTALRSDATHALSQAIVPTWTGAHKFSNVVKFGEIADPGLAAADEYWLNAQDDSGITRLYAHNSRAAWVVNQDNYVIARNVSGSTIPKMRCVRATGGSANRPTIGLADSSIGPCGGVTAANAANNAFVEVMTLGVLTNVDTSAWAPGTRLYLGTAGVLTSVPPAYPATMQLMGVVLDQHASNGSVYITRTSDVRAGLTAGDAFANPSASIGLTAVNGSAITMMRSDAAPALSQTIAPTWTAQHVFAASGHANASAIRLVSPDPAISFSDSNNALNEKEWEMIGNGTTWAFGLTDDAFGNFRAGLQFTRTGAAFTNIRFGNATDNPPYNFLGTGATVFGGTVQAAPLVGALDGTVNTKIQSINSTSSGMVGTQSNHPLEIRTNNTIRATWGASGGLLVAGATGGNMGAGTINATGLYVNGVAVAAGVATGANPTASAGLTAVNGVATTFMRSDGAPAISQTIAPTWTGTHQFTQAPILTSAAPELRWFENDQSADENDWRVRAQAKTFLISTVNNALVSARNVLAATRGTGIALADIAFGNVADNTTFTFNGTGVVTSGGVHRGPDASAAAPTYSWSLDSDTGIYRAATGDMRFSSDGTLCAIIRASGSYFVNGTAANPGVGFINEPDCGLFIAATNRMALTTGGQVGAWLTPPGVGAGGGWCVTGQLDASYFSTIYMDYQPATPTGRIGVVNGSGTAGPLTFAVTAVDAPVFTSTSSRSIKRVTGAPKRAADILSKLRPLLYRLLEGDDREQLGLIAEDVHEACPQLSDGKSVAYDRLAILLLAAWQEEHAEAA